MTDFYSDNEIWIDNEHGTIRLGAGDPYSVAYLTPTEARAVAAALIKAADAHDELMALIKRTEPK